MKDKFHHFIHSTDNIPLPEKFTYPFHYTPHPLSILAAEQLQAYLQAQTTWQRELQKGKMFGVLIVRTQEKELGFLAAFSGLLAGSNTHDYFVPPIYDLQDPHGFFKAEEKNISAINEKIEELESSEEYLECQQELAEEERLAKLSIGMAKMQLQQNKIMRDEKRKGNPSAEEENSLIRESQFQKAEFKRLKEHHAQEIAKAQQAVDEWEREVERLKTERKQRSAALQKQLFDQFQILNAKGEIKSLCALFKETEAQIPPAGAGECAAPRLLQYAYLHEMEPLAMAEFWWGESPKTELRRHGYFYPSCQNKCAPILKHMLQGLEVEENPLLQMNAEHPIEVIWEDKWIAAINKPAGMLSVPGKSDLPSVEEWARMTYPQATGPLIVHRLDMTTSGVMLIAKTKEIHEKLQQLFKNREIKKRYIAILNGTVEQDSGTIDLPICLNPDNRPQQMVSTIYGKEAVTQYKVLSRSDHKTRIAFYPITGRTHQLRVHAAHQLGLNMPIIGDELYGKKGDRLMLHAEKLEFVHPKTKEYISIEKKAEF